jgi:hypothetical protein
MDSGKRLVDCGPDFEAMINIEHGVSQIRDQVTQRLEQILFVIRAMRFKPAFVIIGFQGLEKQKGLA